MLPWRQSKPILVYFWQLKEYSPIIDKTLKNITHQNATNEEYVSWHVVFYITFPADYSILSLSLQKSVQDNSSPNPSSAQLPKMPYCSED